MITFLQLTISGLLLGGIYALVALGFVLIYKSTGVFNFAEGGLLVLGAWIGYTFLMIFHLSFWISLLLTLIFSAILGFLVQHLIMRPLIGQPILALIMVTIALFSFIDGACILGWGHTVKSYPELFSSAPLYIGSIVLSRPLLFSFICSIILLGIFAYLFRYTKWGLAMRAVAERHEVSMSMGINVKTVFGIAWATGCITAAIGGILLGMTCGVSAGLAVLGMMAFPAVMLGGLESVEGAIIGGFSLGVLQNLSGGYLDPIVGGGVRELFPFIMIIFILLIRPSGLFGLAKVERI